MNIYETTLTIEMKVPVRFAIHGEDPEGKVFAAELREVLAEVPQVTYCLKKMQKQKVQTGV